MEPELVNFLSRHLTQSQLETEIKKWVPIALKFTVGNDMLVDS